MRLIITICFVFYASLFVGYAEFTQSVRGRVIDENTRRPLQGVSVKISDRNPVRGAITKSDGTFIIENVPIGRLDISASFVGYEPVARTGLKLVSGKELTVNFELKQSYVVSDVIEVSAYKKIETNNDLAVSSARSFSVEETERYAGSLGDPARMAQNFAGVVAAEDSRNDIIIRGNSPTGLLWKIDGIEVYNPNHFGVLGSTGGPVSILNNNQLADSDFMTGAWNAEYGNVLSGVFDLKLRKGNKYEHEFLGQVGFNGFELGAEGPFSKNYKGSYLINYRYSTMDLVSKIDSDFFDGAIPEYQDLSMKIHLPSEKAGNFDLFAIAGTSQIFFSGDREQSGTYDNDPGVDIVNGSSMATVGLTHSIILGDNTFLKSYATFGGIRARTKLDSLPKYTHDGKARLFYNENSEESKYGIGTSIRHNVNRKNTFQAGLTIDSYNPRYIDSALIEDTFDQYRSITDIDEKNLMLYRAYLHWRTRITEDLTFNAGLHGQLFGYNNTWAIEPRTTLDYKFTPLQSAYVGFGMHSKTQPLFSYFVKNYSDDYSDFSRTNTQMDFTRAFHYTAGYNINATKNIRIKLEAYYQSLYDIPVEKDPSYFSYANFGADFWFPRRDSLVNEGTGENYGIELTCEKFFSDGYYFLATASLYESKYKTLDDIERNTAFANNYVVNLLGGYEYKISDKHTINMSMRTTYAGGPRLIPINKELSKAAGKAKYDYENSYSVQAPDYFRLDLRLAYTLNGKSITQEWAVDLQNLTDRDNVFSNYYSKKTNSIKYTYRQGFFPMVLYRIYF